MQRIWIVLFCLLISPLASAQDDPVDYRADDIYFRVESTGGYLTGNAGGKSGARTWTAQRIVLRPASADGADFTVTESDEVPSEPGHRGWRVRGTKPERWVRQTDFSNDEAVGFLADRLNRLGVEDRLLQLGAEEGDDVVIGGTAEQQWADAVVFDFDPTITAGAEVLGRRGEDLRMERNTRRTNQERREQLAAQRANEAERTAARGGNPADVGTGDVDDLDELGDFEEYDEVDEDVTGSGDPR